MQSNSNLHVVSSLRQIAEQLKITFGTTEIQTNGNGDIYANQTVYCYGGLCLHEYRDYERSEGGCKECALEPIRQDEMRIHELSMKNDPKYRESYLIREEMKGRKL